MGVEAYYPWEFDPSLGAAASLDFVSDKSGNGNDLTGFNPTAVVIADTINEIERFTDIFFDGNSKLMYSVPNGGFMTAPIDFRSVGMWIRPSSLSGRQTLYEEGNLGGGIGLRLNGGTLQSAISVIYSAIPLDFDTYEISAPFPNDGAWHHIAYTYDSDEFKIYIDGVPVDSVDTGIGPFPIDATSEGGFSGNWGWHSFMFFDFTLAQITAFLVSDPPSDFYTGLMDFTTVHDIALSQDQIEDLIANSGDRHGLTADSYTVTV